MSNMKSRALLTMLPYLMAMGASGDNMEEEYVESPEEKAARLKANTEKVNKAKGLTKFTIEGVDVWALNYNNAIRKFKKLSK